MKTRLYIYLLFSLTLYSINAQISGIINNYTKVIDITTPCPKITVSDASGFAADDKVLIIQMKGATVLTANNNTFGNISAYNNAGNYEFAEIRNIQGLDIHLKHELLRDYDPVDLVQLVRIPQYTDVTVAGTLTAQAWDGNTGGVLVFEASGTVTLNADIDVSGLGFKGGKVNIDDNAAQSQGCFGNMVLPNTSPVGASKGESISHYITNTENGAAKQANGGGGGLWNNSGGGGGSNYGNGGRGGNAGACGFWPSSPGLGAVSLTYNTLSNKIFLGGGGGGGHQNNYDGVGPPTRPGATPGGRGGGIVIIKAAILQGNGFSINAKGSGSPIGESWGDGAGGGGGGGAILLEVPDNASPITVNASGGKGDDLYLETGSPLGPGGGGGGGVLYVSTTTVDTDISTTLAGGLSGVITSTSSPNGAIKGTDGGILTDLKIPESTTIGTGCTTPLQLLSFTASLQNSRVHIKWVTAQEAEIDRYLIQRSTDGSLFETIASISPQKGEGVHYYSFHDFQTPERQLLYYRLAEVGPTPPIKQLSTISVQNTDPESWLEVSPNPFSETLKIKFLKPLQHISLIDVNGKTFLEIGTFEEDSVFDLDASTLPAGLYILQMRYNGDIRHQKLLKH